MKYRSYDKFVAKLPKKGSVDSSEGAKALLRLYLEEGVHQALFEVSEALSPRFAALRHELHYTWSLWVDEGGEDDYIPPQKLTDAPIGAWLIRKLLES